MTRWNNSQSNHGRPRGAKRNNHIVLWQWLVLLHVIRDVMCAGNFPSEFAPRKQASVLLALVDKISAKASKRCCMSGRKQRWEQRPNKSADKMVNKNLGKNKNTHFVRDLQRNMATHTASRVSVADGYSRRSREIFVTDLAFFCYSPPPCVTLVSYCRIVRGGGGWNGRIVL